MYIDSHCHLNLSAFDGDREEVAERAFNAGCQSIIEISVDVDSTKKMLSCFANDKRFYFALGMHPHESGQFADNIFSEYDKVISQQERIVAIGEIGLDRTAKTPEHVQIDVFQKCLEYASKKNLPVIIHSRDCFEQTISCIENSGVKKVLFHCFTGDKTVAKVCIDNGYYLSFSGILTYKNADSLREAFLYAPKEYVLAESDAPYLAPQMYRGKRNEPLYVKDLIKFMATLKGEDENIFFERVLNNTKQFFNIL